MLQKNRKFIAVGLTSLMGLGFAYLAVHGYQDYQFGLFVWLPLVMGVVSTFLYGYKNEPVRPDLHSAWKWSLVILCVGMLFLAFEGIICLVMAAPIGFLFGWIGYLIGHAILGNRFFGKAPLTTLLFVFSIPAVMAFEDKIEYEETVRSVVTTVEIAATPEEVWKNVVEFPELQPPTELLFKAGIAYPINANIEGKGFGAMRYCNFSTGRFIEPITNWDEPNLLQFDVIDQPEPMQELSLYDIHPNHLHGYWVSKKGQFKLTRLENGHTRLEGTTWYVNKIQPAFYWTLWSDHIVHQIHERVLNHIKTVSEK